VVLADPALLEGRESLVVAGDRIAVVRRAGTDDRPILRLAGHSSREAAEALRGEPLLVPVEEAPALEEGEFWAHDLVGCAVVDGSRSVGVVSRMVALPSCEALEVVGGDRELLVPMVRDAIRSVDVAARRIDVDLAFLGE
jgi:16S rRNA processing protein RimM